MESILLKIQDTVAKYAEVLSKISRVDVEVVDNRLYRVAGTEAKNLGGRAVISGISGADCRFYYD